MSSTTQHAQYTFFPACSMDEICYPGPCGCCGFPLRRKRVVVARLLDVSGWRRVRHLLLRCRNEDCPRKGRVYGYNFVSESTVRCKKLVVEWMCAEPMQYWFILPTCGFTTAWLRQISRRIALQYTSFQSESHVHELEARRLGDIEVVPNKAANKIQRGWTLWRLVS